MRQPSFPVNYFSVALGTLALGLALRYAESVHIAVLAFWAEAVCWFGVIVWLILVIDYSLRWFTERTACLTECRDKVLCCFISLVPITTLEVALVLHPYSKIISEVLLGLGILGQLLFAITRTTSLWRGIQDRSSTTPVLYLPGVAANFCTATVLGVLGFEEWGMLFLGAGFLSWLSLESSVLGRLRTEPQLEPSRRGMIGIELAPPFVGALALLSVNGGEINIFVLGLIGYGILLLLYFTRMILWLFEEGFTMSLWGFSFGLAAMANVGIHLVAVHRLHQLGWFMFGAGSFALLTLWILTISRWMRSSIRVRLSQGNH